MAAGGSPPAGCAGSCGPASFPLRPGLRGGMGEVEGAPGTASLPCCARRAGPVCSAGRSRMNHGSGMLW